MGSIGFCTGGHSCSGSGGKGSALAQPVNMTDMNTIANIISAIRNSSIKRVIFSAALAGLSYTYYQRFVDRWGYHRTRT